MSQRTVKTCDVCGIEHDSKNEKRHWSDTIARISLSFKNHPALQSVAFEGDICSSCALELKNVIIDYLGKKKTP